MDPYRDARVDSIGESRHAWHEGIIDLCMVVLDDARATVASTLRQWPEFEDRAATIDRYARSREAGLSSFGQGEGKLWLRRYERAVETWAWLACLHDGRSDMFPARMIYEVAGTFADEAVEAQRRLLEPICPRGFRRIDRDAKRFYH